MSGGEWGPGGFLQAQRVCREDRKPYVKVKERDKKFILIKCDVPRIHRLKRI